MQAPQASTAEFRILVVDDHLDSCLWRKLLLERGHVRVAMAHDGAEAERVLVEWLPDVVLMDMVLPDVEGLDLLRRCRQQRPDTEVIMVTGHGTIQKAVDAMRAGALSFIEKPVDPEVLQAVLDKTRERLHLMVENRRLRERVTEEEAFLGDLLSKSPRMRRVFDLVRRVAPTDASVLIRGKNGTGKELVANAIHQHSMRARGPLVKINCAAIPPDLIESELFGYRRGAFTGAVADKVGLFEQANGGTLMLDEIGDLPLALQAKLLRVLQERQARPLGSHRLVDLDFRLVCATNADLEASIAEGRFREDVYFRINTITVSLPALCERPEDIPLLVDHFLKRYAKEYDKPVTGWSQAAFSALMTHPWRGNVRELQHAVERAVIVGRGGELTLDDLPEAFQRRDAVVPAPTAAAPLATLAEIERSAIVRTLMHTRGNKRAAAEILGVYRPTLYSKLRKYQLGDYGVRRAGAAAPSGPA